MQVPPLEPPTRPPPPAPPAAVEQPVGNVTIAATPTAAAAVFKVFLMPVDFIVVPFREGINTAPCSADAGTKYPVLNMCKPKLVTYLTFIFKPSRSG
jgi:hypothetical protein